MSLTNSQLSVLDNLNVVLSSISIVACLFIIISYVLIKPLRSFAFRMILFISLADFGFAIGHLMGNQSNGSVGCHIQSYFVTYFELVSLMWTLMIARVLQRIFLLGEIEVEKEEKIFQITCWGLPFLMIFLPESTSSYGNSGWFCWIKGNGAVDTMWRFLVFYCWLWVGIIYIVWVYYKIRLQFANMLQEQLDIEEQKQMMDRIKYYPVTLIVCYFFASINRIYIISNPNNPNYTLTALHVLGVSLKGVFNSFIYGYNGHAGAALYHWVVSVFQHFGFCMNVIATDPFPEEETNPYEIPLEKEKVMG